MDTGETPQHPAETPDNTPSIQCTACESALRSPGRDTVSFLLVDRFTIPLVGCENHLKQFSSICGLTAESDTTLLSHPPAGGVPCPGCRHARHTVEQPVVPLHGGALAVLACPRHQSEIVARFREGLQTRHHLTASLDQF